MAKTIKYVTEQGMELYYKHIPFDIMQKIESLIDGLFELWDEKVPLKDKRMEIAVKNIKDFKIQYKDNKKITDAYLRVIRGSNIGEVFFMSYDCDIAKLLMVTDDQK